MYPSYQSIALIRFFSALLRYLKGQTSLSRNHKHSEGSCSNHVSQNSGPAKSISQWYRMPDFKRQRPSYSRFNFLRSFLESHTFRNFFDAGRYKRRGSGFRVIVDVAFVEDNKQQHIVMEERYQNKEKVEEGESMEVEEKAAKRKRDEREKEKEKEEEEKDGESEKKKQKQQHITLPSRTETFTITLGDSAENHVGMQKLGTMAAEGFSLADLQKAKAWFEERGVEVTIHHLNTALPKDAQDEAASAPAYVLVAKNGLKAMMDPNAFHAEQAALEKDTKALMYVSSFCFI